MKISEYQQLFLSESQEILNSLNNLLIGLEKDPQDSALLHELFRQSHTLKSMAQSMGYKDMSTLTHSLEEVLSFLRSGKTKVKKQTMGLLFESVDLLSDLTHAVEEGKSKEIEVLPILERFDEIISTFPQEGKKPSPKSKQKSKPDDNETSSVEEVQTVRVPLSQLDGLMDLTGEMVINRNRFARIAQSLEHDALKEMIAEMSRLTSQLQLQMLKVRLVPLNYIFTPYPRMVRDIAIDQNKEVDLLIEGGDIGLDRSIQNEINEPLLHLLKNAVIHGIEEPKERERLNKPRRGKIKLSAKRERNSAVLELSDDGQGIDTKDVKEIALKTGMITKEELAALTPKEVLKLVTYPGYSGAKKVTEGAGRGVGLNAARTKIESLGGTLEIDTRPNEGTTLFIKLPLTMAIAETMRVGIADETYCIPLSYIAETIKISAREIKTVGYGEMIAYRDSVLPLISLREKLGFSSSRVRSSASDVSSRISSILVVVVEIGSKKAGLVVDRLLGQQETVIKPLTGILEKIKGASGATILSTGKTALILDIGSLL
jgi:two-component system chemotaxis sensor kinase CheA